MMNFKLYALFFPLAVLLIVASLMPMASTASESDGRHLRPMSKSEVPELGLVIWTELKPQWIVNKSSKHGRVVLTAQTPIATHPPAAFTYTSFSEMLILDEELKSVAQEMAKSAKVNFRSIDNEEHFVNLSYASYGSLNGYELMIEGFANGEEIDVKIFLGQSESMPPVLLQAYTLRGKLQAISENIRRSWSNVSYMAEPP